MLFFLRDEEIQENKVCARSFSPWGRWYQKDSFGCILQVNDFNFLAYFVCSTATPVLPQLYWTCRKHQYFVWFGFHPFNCLFAESYWAGPLDCSQGVTHLWPCWWCCWGHCTAWEVRPMCCDSVEVTHQGWKWLDCEKSEVNIFSPLYLNYYYIYS